MNAIIIAALICLTLGAGLLIERRRLFDGHRSLWQWLGLGDDNE